MAATGFRVFAKDLLSLQLGDPFLVPNSMKIVENLRTDGMKVRDSFSIDVVDLYYSIPHAYLVQSVKDGILIDNASGVSVENFLELLALYLKYTLVGRGEKVYVQKAGICIGSPVAPVIGNVFLSKVEETIDNDFVDENLKLFEYVDYFDLVKETQHCSTLVDVMKKLGPGVHF